MITDIIINERKRKKLKQSDMAKRLSVSRATYQRWESGSVSATNLENMLSALDLKMIIINKEQL